jgi:hypothetical protein
MKQINNFENVQASTGEFNKPTANGYCVEILSVKDVPIDNNTGKGNYLEIEYDICHGEFAGYYTKQNERFGGKWFANFIRSYKDTALGMFKHFINCVEASNPNYKWDWNEKGLEHKYLGVVLGEEEYKKNDGTLGVKLVVKDIKTVEQIATGDFKVPPIKRLTAEAKPFVMDNSNFEELANDDDLPFN